MAHNHSLFMVGDDSSAIKKLREEFGEVKKVSDLNHVKKNLGNPISTR